MRINENPPRKSSRNTFGRYTFFILSLVLAMFPIGASAQGVLLITSLDLAGDFQSTTDAAVLEVMRENSQNLAFYREDLSMVSDYERFDKDEWVRAINLKYAGAQIVRVVGAGPFARLLVEQTRDELLPTTTKYEVAGSKVIQHVPGQQAKVLSESERTISTLNLINKLTPNTKRVVLISGDPKTPSQMRSLFENTAQQIIIELWGLDKSYADILKESSFLGSETVS